MCICNLIIIIMRIAPFAVVVFFLAVKAISVLIKIITSARHFQSEGVIIIDRQYVGEYAGLGLRRRSVSRRRSAGGRASSPGCSGIYFNDPVADHSHHVAQVVGQFVTLVGPDAFAGLVAAGVLIVDVLKLNPRTLPSKIEVRPSMPPKKRGG